MKDGRRFEPELSVRARRRDDGLLELLAPSPGLWRGAPEPGTLVSPGGPLGELEVLGVLHRLRTPSDAYGVVSESVVSESVVFERAGSEGAKGRRLARRPVEAGAVLVVLDPDGVVGARGAAIADEARAASGGGPVFKTPLGGRYYAKPSPDAEPFVRVGDEIEAGTTVALIEVMKTFNRVSYAGAQLPARARIVAIVPADGDDVEAADVLLELEAVAD